MAIPTLRTLSAMRVSLPLALSAVALACIAPLACMSPHQPANGPTLLDSVAFHTGFPLTPHFSGTYLDPATGKDYLYFADPVSRKELLFFTPDGQLTDSIPLQAAVDSMNEVAGIAVVSLDSILLCSKYTNRLLAVDRVGRCSRVLDLTPLLRYKGHQYELWPSFFSSFRCDDHLYFSVSLVAAVLPPADGDIASYWQLDSGSPAGAFVHFVHGEPVVEWRLERFWTDHAACGHAMPQPGGLYAWLNNRVILFSYYSDRIHVLDPMRERNTDSLVVRSAHTPCAVPCRPLNESTFLHLQDSVNEWLDFGPHIANIKYDERLHHYLVTVQHVDKRQRGPGQLPPVVGGTVITYDSNFHKVQETEFADMTRNQVWRLNTSKGTLLKRFEDKRSRMGGVHVFDRLALP